MLMIAQVDCIRRGILCIYRALVEKMEVSTETLWMIYFCCLHEMHITLKNTMMQWKNWTSHQKLIELLDILSGRLLLIKSMKNKVTNMLQQLMPHLLSNGKGRGNKILVDWITGWRMILYDIVSMLDGYAITKDTGEWNPLMAHSYIPFEANGLYNINAGTNISNGINPNT